MAKEFKICKNQYLSKDITGYYNLYYTGYGNPDNPYFLNTLKNTYNDELDVSLQKARDKVVEILIDDIPAIMTYSSLKSCTCICIPRAKALNTYTDSQLFFRDAVSIASSKLPSVIDGSDIIERHKNTFTTHFSKTRNPSRVAKVGLTTKTIDGNDGSIPYPGITNDTCYIDKNRVKGKDIILIDDIYTLGTNIDEDGIQALLYAGANNVIFYAIAYTWRG